MQDNLYRFNPTVHLIEWDKVFELAENFINLKADKPKLFYIWGHSYEFDIHNTWNEFEEFCRFISNKAIYSTELIGMFCYSTENMGNVTILSI